MDTEDKVSSNVPGTAEAHQNALEVEVEHHVASIGEKRQHKWADVDFRVGWHAGIRRFDHLLVKLTCGKCGRSVWSERRFVAVQHDDIFGDVAIAWSPEDDDSGRHDAGHELVCPFHNPNTYHLGVTDKVGTTCVRCMTAFLPVYGREKPACECCDDCGGENADCKRCDGCGIDPDFWDDRGIENG